LAKVPIKGFTSTDPSLLRRYFVSQTIFEAEKEEVETELRYHPRTWRGQSWNLIFSNDQMARL